MAGTQAIRLPAVVPFAPLEQPSSSGRKHAKTHRGPSSLLTSAPSSRLSRPLSLSPSAGTVQSWKHECIAPKMAALKATGQTSTTGSSNSGPSIRAAAGVSTLQKIDFKKLQNGSDIRGVALEGVEGEPVNVMPEAVEAIAQAFAGWIVDKKKKEGGAKPDRKYRISIGHDSRLSAKSLREAAGRGVASAGFDVVQYNLASTPAMFNSTLTQDESLLTPADGSIMITASHLPFNRNGMKFFTNTGGTGKADITDILARAATIYDGFTEESLEKSAQAAASATTEIDYMKRYTADLVEAVRKGARGVEKPLDGFHIVVDAGNGAGGFFAPDVLEPLGARTDGSQFLDPDGTFPNHIPNPEDETAMAAIQRAVLDNKADFGIIFDTDVDRSAAVDSGGKEINRNRLIALLSAIILAEHPGTTVVTDSVTSDGLTQFIEKLGGKHHRFKRGYKNVIDEGIRLNSVGQETHLAIETSGHGALKENNWLDDGAYAMVKLLIKMAAAATAGEGRGSAVLTKLIEELQEAEVAMELRFKIDQGHPDVHGDFKAYVNKVLAALEQSLKEDDALQKAPVNHEGIRVSGHGGWFLLRLSLHDPVLPLNIEAPSKEDAKKLAAAVSKVVEKFEALDVSALQKVL